MNTIYGCSYSARNWTRRRRGNTLLTLMISLTLLSVLLAGVVKLYSSVSNNSQVARKTNLLSVSSGTVLLKIMDDVQHAGSFGCFNARIVGSRITTAVSESIPLTISGYGRFESEYNGLKVFSADSITAADSSALSLVGDNLVSGSQILKIQYGRRYALIDSSVLNGSNLQLLNLESASYQVVSGNSLAKTARSKYGLVASSSSNALFMLASCNRIDELQGGLSNNVMTINSALRPIAASSHDNTSWRLMNMETRYYYLATSGGIKSLYSKYLQANGSISESQLVLRGVNSLSYSLVVESGTSYQTKTFNTMLINDWSKVIQLNLNLELQAISGSSSDAIPLIESLSQSIMLPN